MKPSALEDLWTVVRLAAEGSDWKRDQGETLCDWAQRKLRPTPRPEAASSEKMRAMLNTCREEFCWHGNTGKSLSTAAYGQLVDQIDAVLDGESEPQNGSKT